MALVLGLFVGLAAVPGCDPSEPNVPEPPVTPVTADQVALDVASSQPLAMRVDEDQTVHIELARYDAMDREDAGDAGYWKFFMFRVDDAAGQRVRLRVHNPQNGGKWSALNPVVLEGMDPDDLAAYETRPVEPGLTRAVNGSRLPDDSGQAWKFIRDSRGRHDGVEFTHTFTSDRAWVAMRYPVTQPLQDAFIERAVSDARQRGLPVERVDLGTTPKGRPLYVLRVGEPASAGAPTLLIYAREHAQDHDAGWVVLGAIEHLLADTPEAARLREHHTFLLIPTVDRDGAAAGLHDRIRSKFWEDGRALEAKAYIRFFRDWVAAGGRVDLTLNLHNHEADEKTHWFAFALSETGEDACFRYQDAYSLRLIDDGYGAALPGSTGWTGRSRLCGAVTDIANAPFIGALVNSQAREEHLTLDRLKQMGAHMLEAFATDGPHVAER